jgi:hypothetical protein
VIIDETEPVEFRRGPILGRQPGGEMFERYTEKARRVIFFAR